MAIPVAAILGREPTPGTGSIHLIENVIVRISERNRDFCRYTVVADAQGRVVHSTLAEVTGGFFDRGEARQDDDGESRVVDGLVYEGEDLFEVGTALVDRGQYLGWIAAGFSLEPIEQQVRRMAGRAALAAMVR